ncbi:MAG: hypothetical protein ACLS3C_02080 [Oscillospiraceae bacterium]
MAEWGGLLREYTTYSSASVPIPQKKGIGKLLAAAGGFGQKGPA